jgi:hypothetical protein
VGEIRFSFQRSGERGRPFLRHTIPVRPDLPGLPRNENMTRARIKDFGPVEDPQIAAMVSRENGVSLPSRKMPVASHPTLASMLPAACLASLPVDVPVGDLFDTLVLPEPQARQALARLAHHRPHPMGAALARPGEWVLFLPPRSGYETDWPTPAVHKDSGTLQVPPVLAPADGHLRWARLGNAGRTGRAFTAPMMLDPVLPLLCVAECPVPDSQMPVRI